MEPPAPSARRPAADEYAPFYEGYVAGVPQGDVLECLRAQRAETLGLLRGLPAPRRAHRYAPGKWAVQELLGHLVDAEWIFVGRALWFARGAEGPLPGMDQDAFVAESNAAARPWEGLLAEYDHLRSAALELFASFDGPLLDRRGVASGCAFTVRALPWIVAGHERHHLDVLRERYL